MNGKQSAKFDRRTKQHTEFGVSKSNGSRDIARTKLWWKKKRKKMNVDNPIKHPLRGSLIIIITRQVLGRPVCDQGAIPRTLVQSNVVRSRLIILINEEIIKANKMVSNSAKLDRRTKQHTQFGVSAINGSRDMGRTKSLRKKNNEANWMVSNSAKLDCRTKQHTQFGVSSSNGSRDMARTKSWRKKKKKKEIMKRIGW